MFAKLNHLAIVTDQYALMGKFYECAFGLKEGKKKANAARALSIGDGHVGININPTKPGRKLGLDHFGFEVEDVETFFERCRKKYPTVKWQERPSSRPFAGLTSHDPDGNVIDISQKDMKNRTGVYVADSWEQDRTFSHLSIRTLRPDLVAEFYTDVFEMSEEGTHCLTDGHMTLILTPWDITNYANTNIIGPGIDHIGFKVESVAQTIKDIEEIADNNPSLTPRTVGRGREQAARLELFKKCPMGEHQMADVDGVLIDISEG
jgi:catechol 2,3-dioxygenase-like lactoylglutathione lyase family enzyme